MNRVFYWVLCFLFGAYMAHIGHRVDSKEFWIMCAIVYGMVFTFNWDKTGKPKITDKDIEQLRRVQNSGLSRSKPSDSQDGGFVDLKKK